MTLSEQISLVDQMIRENPDYTIRDYLDLCAEIQSVADSMKNKCSHFIFHQTITGNDHYRKTHTPLRFYGR